jgi:hypothetical protein
MSNCLVRERGSAALELVILAPVLLAVIGLVILGGRIQIAAGAVEQAAADAARQASLSRDPGSARSKAMAAASDALRREAVPCTSVSVELHMAGFGVPVGVPAQVGAHVSCVVPLSGLVLGAPGSKTLSADAVSVLDTYRERTSR